jgi:hypothetical protein
MPGKATIQTHAIGHIQGVGFGQPHAKIVVWNAQQREGLENKIAFGVVKVTKGASAQISESPDNEQLLLLLIG